jgi:hypothetical protein
MDLENIPQPRRHVDPRTVVSPVRSITDLEVIFDGGLWTEDNPHWSGWSAARMTYDGDPGRYGYRYNGEIGVSLGYPNSYGRPTWSMLPGAMGENLAKLIREHLKANDDRKTSRLYYAIAELIDAARSASQEELTELRGSLRL